MLNLSPAGSYPPNRGLTYCGAGVARHSRQKHFFERRTHAMTDELFAQLREREGDWNPCSQSQQPEISWAAEQQLMQMRGYSTKAEKPKRKNEPLKYRNNTA